MLQNAYLVLFTCKYRRRYSRKRVTFWRNFAKNWRLPYGSTPWACTRADLAARVAARRVAASSTGLLNEAPGAWSARPRERHGGAKLANFAKFCKFIAGSFSAVSKRNFARKYAFDSIFQALQDVHTFAPLQSQNFS